MPLDPMMTDALLGTFRNMVEECKQKNTQGEDFDNLCKAFERLENLAQEHDDMNAFNAQVMEENLYGQISDFYGRVLSAEAKSSATGESGEYDDSALLKTCVDALKQAIVTIKQSYEDAISEAKGENAKQQNDAAMDYIARNHGDLVDTAGGMDKIRKSSEESFDKTMKETPNAFDNSVEVEVLSNPEEIIKPIQKLIDLGEQADMTLPRFLRIQIETGMDKAMEGSVTVKDGLYTEKEFILANPVTPYDIEKIDKKISEFERLASENKFGIPNLKEFAFIRDDIDREFEPQIIKWKKITDMWDNLLWDLSFWSMSYLSYARYLEPWSLSKNPPEAVIDTQDTTPGVFKEREKLFKKYFDISFMEIFRHPTFEWSVKYNYISYSQEFVEFIAKKIYPECKPFNHLSSELINERGTFHKKDKNSFDKEGNPESHIPADRQREFYNKKFGEGRFESKFGTISESESKADKWDYNAFSDRNT